MTINCQALSHSRTFFYARLLQFAVALLIFSVMALKPIPSDQMLPYPPLLLHFIGNCLLMLSCWVAMAGRFKLYKLILPVVAFSATIEAAQSLTGTRTTDWVDLAANIGGVTLGLCLCFAAEKVLALRP